jgi:predicted transposase
MARNTEEERVTVVGKLLVLDEISASKLLLLMRKFRDAVEIAHSLLYKRGLSESEVKRRLTKYLSNAWYAYSAIKVARLYREQNTLD